jgi:dTDP-4-dehydrorhamnose reductase
VRALVTGGGGQLANDISRLLGDSARSFTHAELDITDTRRLDAAFDEVQPEIVFNCAAFHNLDSCEQQPDTAWAVNVRAVRELARRSPRLVHISTNYVFDGRRDEPYAEDDPPSPRSIYALTKLAGEYAALVYGEHALVVRSAGLFGLRGSASKGGNFVERMIRRAGEQGALSVVSDQRLQPTFTADLARAILDAVAARACGVLHLTADGACSWYEFTVAILEEVGIDASVESSTTAAAPGAVDRPFNGVLARPRADAIGLEGLRPWRDALADYLRQARLTVA